MSRPRRRPPIRSHADEPIEPELLAAPPEAGAPSLPPPDVPGLFLKSGLGPDGFEERPIHRAVVSAAPELWPAGGFVAELVVPGRQFQAAGKSIVDAVANLRNVIDRRRLLADGPEVIDLGDIRLPEQED